MDYKQHELIKIILKRIADKEYTDLLPRAADLAQEFQVNSKTVDKALLRLVKQGVLERKRRVGTRVVPVKQYADPVVEVLFSGFAAIFAHPFWHNIWEAMFQELSEAGFHVTLTELNSDPKTGLINFTRLAFFPAVGRIVLGSYEKLLLDRIAETGIPFITACDQLDEKIPQVSIDFAEGIGDAVDFLHQKGCRKIGFIGETRNLIHLHPSCIGDTRPVMGGGAIALQGMLESATPDALIVASDNQLPEILQELHQRGIEIPVIGCDGLELPNIPARRPMVRAPLRECGKLVAEKIVQSIHTRRRAKSTVLKARFEPGEN